MTIGKKIKELRKEKKMTQKELSVCTGIAEITIRQYEADKYRPKFEQMKKISDALNITIDYFIDNYFEAPDIQYEHVGSVQVKKPDPKYLELSEKYKNGTITEDELLKLNSRLINGLDKLSERLLELVSTFQGLSKEDQDKIFELMEFYKQKSKKTGS